MSAFEANLDYSLPTKKPTLVFSLKEMFSIKALALRGKKKKKPFLAKKTLVLPWFGSYIQSYFLLLLQGEMFQHKIVNPPVLGALNVLLSPSISDDVRIYFCQPMFP